MLGRPAARPADKAGRVAVVHHDERPVALRELADLRQLREISIHGEDAVGHHQLDGQAEASASLRSRSAMSPCA